MSAEEIIVQKVKDGDQLAFRQLVNLYSKRLYGLAYDLAGDQQDAEDLIQEVFMKVYTNIGKFRGDASLNTWLHRITVNTWINMKKSKLFRIKKIEQRMDECGELHKGEGSRIAEQDQLTDLQKHIEICLNKLSNKERLIFVLRHFHDQSLREISDSTNLTVGTVKSLLFRAVKKLRKSMAYYYQEVS